MRDRTKHLARIGRAILAGLCVSKTMAAEPAKPFVETEDLVKIVESLEWEYLRLQWTTDGGDYVREGPEITIVRHDEGWVQYYRPTVRPDVKRESIDLSAEELARFATKLGEFMVIADKEVDFFESLQGLTKRQARQEQRRKEGAGFGIGQFGYSLELRQGGQTLTTGDAFTQTESMLKWMRSQSPKGD